VLRIVRLAAFILLVTASLVRARGLAAAIGIVAIFGTIFTVVAGPLMVRHDLRQDLARARGLLKTWAVRAAWSFAAN